MYKHLAPGAAKYFGAYVHHYGYVKDLKADTMKTSRNILEPFVVIYI